MVTVTYIQFAVVGDEVDFWVEDPLNPNEGFNSRVDRSKFEDYVSQPGKVVKIDDFVSRLGVTLTVYYLTGTYQEIVDDLTNMIET